MTPAFSTASTKRHAGLLNATSRNVWYAKDAHVLSRPTSAAPRPSALSDADMVGLLGARRDRVVPEALGVPELVGHHLAEVDVADALASRC